MRTLTRRRGVGSGHADQTNPVRRGESNLTPLSPSESLFAIRTIPAALMEAKKRYGKKATVAATLSPSPNYWVGIMVPGISKDIALDVLGGGSTWDEAFENARRADDAKA